MCVLASRPPTPPVACTPQEHRHCCQAPPREEPRAAQARRRTGLVHGVEQGEHPGHVVRQLLGEEVVGCTGTRREGGPVRGSAECCSHAHEEQARRQPASAEDRRRPSSLSPAPYAQRCVTSERRWDVSWPKAAAIWPPSCAPPPKKATAGQGRGGERVSAGCAGCWNVSRQWQAHSKRRVSSQQPTRLGVRAQPRVRVPEAPLQLHLPLQQAAKVRGDCPAGGKEWGEEGQTTAELPVPAGRRLRRLHPGARPLPRPT